MIEDNDSLTDLVGLNSLMTVERLYIFNNDILAACLVDELVSQVGGICSPEWGTNCYCANNNGAGTCD